MAAISAAAIHPATTAAAIHAATATTISCRCPIPCWWHLGGGLFAGALGRWRNDNVIFAVTDILVVSFRRAWVLERQRRHNNIREGLHSSFPSSHSLTRRYRKKNGLVDILFLSERKSLVCDLTMTTATPALPDEEEGIDEATLSLDLTKPLTRKQETYARHHFSNLAALCRNGFYAQRMKDEVVYRACARDFCEFVRDHALLVSAFEVHKDTHQFYVTETAGIAEYIVSRKLTKFVPSIVQTLPLIQHVDRFMYHLFYMPPELLQDSEDDRWLARRLALEWSMETFRIACQARPGKMQMYLPAALRHNLSSLTQPPPPPLLLGDSVPRETCAALYVLKTIARHSNTVDQLTRHLQTIFDLQPNVLVGECLKELVTHPANHTTENGDFCEDARCLCNHLLVLYPEWFIPVMRAQSRSRSVLWPVGVQDWQCYGRVQEWNSMRLRGWAERGLVVFQGPKSSDSNQSAAGAGGATS